MSNVLNKEDLKHQEIQSNNKIEYLKRKYFLNQDNRNRLILTFAIIITIALFLLTATVYVDLSGSFSNLFKNNWKSTIQMVLTGFSLGVASYLLQRMTTNRLADTSIMGFGNFNLIPIAIMAICTNFSYDPDSTKMSSETYYLIQPIVVISSSIILCLIFNFASKDKTKFNFKKLILSGIILNFVAIAIAFSVVSAADPKAKAVIEQKVIGWIGDTTKDFNLYFCMGMIIFAFLVLVFYSKKIELIVQNQDIARQVGIRNIEIMFITMVCIGILVGASYSLSGDFVFVGLFAGNIAFNLTKNRINYGIATSGLIGSIMVLATYFVFFNLIDVNGDIIAPLIPLLISPYFIYLVIRWR